MLEMMRTFRYILLAGMFLFIGVVEGVGQDYSHDVNPNPDGSFSWSNANYGTAGKTTLFTLRGNCSVVKADGKHAKMLVTAGTVIFDLNGFTFTSGGGDFNLFEVQSGATLIIRDSKAGGGGTISGGAIDHSSAAIFVNGGTFNLESGTITGFKQNKAADAPGSGCAVYINGNGKFNMSGGTISHCGFNQEQHYDTEGSIILGTEHKGGAVYVGRANDKYVYSTFNFSGGTIDNCTAFRGGAVYVEAPSDDAGSEFKDVVSSNGFHMSGDAKISNCFASNRGGGVYVEATNKGRGYFNMTGGTIEGCKSRNAGCGVCVRGQFYMSGGTIQNNVPDINGNPADTDFNTNYSNEVLMASNAPIGGGICGEGHDNNVQQLMECAIINISGGKISGNVAASGGGIMASNYSQLTISGVEIIGNHALGNAGTGNGGAVYVDDATFTFNGGKLSGNFARRYGGAININTSSSMTLSGACIISENEAGHGGGISQEAGECSIVLNDQDIEIKDNVARGCYESSVYKEGNGGGLFIEKGTLTISGGKITGNKANGSGGGIALRSERLSGDITLNVSGNVEIANNIANNDRNNEGDGEGKVVGGNGGGIDIYSAPSDQTETKIIANITGGIIKGNSADNGGGISVYIKSNDNNSASISLGEGANAAVIESNTANANGGGLYVFNNTAKASTVAFSGGDILKNASPNGMGGGICVEGKVNLTTTGTNVKNNEAKNGGGIYLSGGAAMIFNGGLICNNEAEGTPVDDYTTAYQNDAKNAGVGGGIYLAANSTLNFFTEGEKPGAFGVYGNTATTAADDIFATGSNTSIQLPKVSGMSLDGFDVPTSELYWVEDYVEHDAKYTLGTKVNSYTDGSGNILRYRYALNNFREINKITFDAASKTYESYVCLALGYEQFFVNLLKKGLKKDDSAIFKVSYLKDDVYMPYRTILFHRTSETDNEGVKASIVLTAGKWKFEENTAWSGQKYNLSGIESNLPVSSNISEVVDGKFTFEIGSTQYGDLKDGAKTFNITITNISSGAVLPPSAESAVTNKIPKLVVQE